MEDSMSHPCAFEDVTCTSDESDRALQGSLLERTVRRSTSAPAQAPVAAPMARSMAPSLAPISKGGDDGGLGWFGMTILLLMGGAVLWGLWVRYQRQVEQRMLDFRSKQADRVLGDMQMVPNEDLDNELL